MERKKALTPASIDTFKAGKHVDPATPGLSIEIRASGKKLRQFRLRIAGNGTTVKMSLGRFQRTRSLPRNNRLREISKACRRTALSEAVTTPLVRRRTLRVSAQRTREQNQHRRGDQSADPHHQRDRHEAVTAREKRAGDERPKGRTPAPDTDDEAGA